MIECYYITNELKASLLSGDQYKTMRHVREFENNFVYRKIYDRYMQYFNRGNGPIYSLILHNPYRNGIITTFNMTYPDTYTYHIPQNVAQQIYNDFMRTHPNDPYQ
jgi:hypothetical protein